MFYLAALYPCRPSVILLCPGPLLPSECSCPLQASWVFVFFLLHSPTSPGWDELGLRKVWVTLRQETPSSSTDSSVPHSLALHLPPNLWHQETELLNREEETGGHSGLLACSWGFRVLSCDHSPL